MLQPWLGVKRRKVGWAVTAHAGMGGDNWQAFSLKWCSLGLRAWDTFD